jgi:acyl-coenzyme A synthetase/AMP-(fatty) acid ligase
MIRMMYCKLNTSEVEIAWCQPGMSKRANCTAVNNVGQKKPSSLSDMHAAGTRLNPHVLSWLFAWVRCSGIHSGFLDLWQCSQPESSPSAYNL